MYCASFAGASTGGAARSRWMWSGDNDPLTIVTFRAAQICRIRSRARSAILARRIFFRYFVHQIMWYFRSKTACALCLYSAISPILAGIWRLEADRLKGGGLKPGDGY